MVKLDHVSRNVHFISDLMAHRASFLVAELGSAVAAFILHPFAALAEKNWAMISSRTRAALAAAKARGVKLGGRKLPETRKAAVATVGSLTDRHATNLLPVIREIQRPGAGSLRDIADALNARDIPTVRADGGTQ